MILRRFSKHLTDQNWFAVVLDIFVVIIGIFLGLQVTDWQQHHQDRQAETAYLKRIENDLHKDISEIKDAIELQTKRLNYAELLINSIESESLALDSPSDFVSAIQYAGYTYTPELNDDTYEELKSSGQLTLIKDQSLRIAISAYYTAVSSRTQWAYLRHFIQTEYLKRSAGILLPEQHQTLTKNYTNKRAFTKQEAKVVYQRFLAKKEFLEWLPTTDFGYQRIIGLERQKKTACELLDSLTNNAATSLCD